MKYVEITDKCKQCIGCNLLEIPTFKGKYRCENFVDGGKTNDLCIGDKGKSSWKRETKI